MEKRAAGPAYTGTPGWGKREKNHFRQKKAAESASFSVIALTQVKDEKEQQGYLEGRLVVTRTMFECHPSACAVRLHGSHISGSILLGNLPDTSPIPTVSVTAHTASMMVCHPFTPLGFILVEPLGIERMILSDVTGAPSRHSQTHLRREEVSLPSPLTVTGSSEVLATLYGHDSRADDLEWGSGANERIIKTTGLLRLKVILDTLRLVSCQKQMVQTASKAAMDRFREQSHALLQAVDLRLTGVEPIEAGNLGGMSDMYTISRPEVERRMEYWQAQGWKLLKRGGGRVLPTSKETDKIANTIHYCFDLRKYSAEQGAYFEAGDSSLNPWSALLASLPLAWWIMSCGKPFIQISEGVMYLTAEVSEVPPSK
ncbi:hypothetical protein VP01_4000g1 [Puccinia sorghi]|uniref:Uncharacterized protein n=1 Tax=Puccinia sorghi TaxID=27349 RepID=A0A0L6USU7_9BASI|nr:hypothetical protein VP01_4000g1 [Puccinia sorghi]